MVFLKKVGRKKDRTFWKYALGFIWGLLSSRALLALVITRFYSPNKF